MCVVYEAEGQEVGLSAILSRCNGPECPHCGCTDSRILEEPNPAAGRGSWWGAGRAKCGYCRREFSFRELPQEAVSERETQAMVEDEPMREEIPMIAVVTQLDVKTIPVVTCSNCETQMKVTSTLKTLRKYKCATCGETAKRAR